MAALVALVLAPAAWAGPPNGTYRFVKATGSATYGGDTYQLTQDMIEQVGIGSSTKFRVRKNKMKIDRGAAERLIQELSTEYGIPVQTTIRGPKTLTLRKSGAKWVGKTSRPIVVNFSVSYSGMNISGTLRSHIGVSVRKKTMVMTTPITGSLLGETVKAKAVVTCKR